MARNSEHKLQIQYTEMSSPSYDHEYPQHHQAFLAAEIRDREEAHQEPHAQMN